MDQTNHQRDQLEDLGEAAVLFSAARGRIEVEIVGAMLSDPETGYAAAVVAEQLTADHFEVHDDMRLLFCACCQGYKHGRDLVIRLGRAALVADKWHLASGLDEWIKQHHIPNRLFQYIAVRSAARRLSELQAADRDARAHLSHAVRLLESQVAA